MENKVASGKFVAFSYKVTDADTGEILFEAKKESPDTMVYGVTKEVPEGLAGVMEGLGVEDRFSVTLPPEVAFGHRVDEYVQTLPLDIFSSDGQLPDEVKVGAFVPMMTADGYRVVGQVTDIQPDKVVMDFNHPFAGKTVSYEGEIVDVRDATEDELSPKQCCGGCQGGGCDNDCDCQHGDSGECGCGGDCNCGK